MKVDAAKIVIIFNSSANQLQGDNTQPILLPKFQHTFGSLLSFIVMHRVLFFVFTIFCIILSYFMLVVNILI